MQSLSVNDLVQDFSERLVAAVELATVERGEAIIAEMFSAIKRSADSYIGRAAKYQAERERRQRVSALTQEFLDAIERPVHAYVRDMLAREFANGRPDSSRSHAVEESSPFAETTAPAAVTSPTRRRPRRVRPNLRLPPPLDPEQIKRDQEFARLRALLKPMADDPVPPAPAPEGAAPPAQPQRPASPGDTLHLLEKEIQDAVPTLGTLGPERCGAQIAVWAGQVRSLRDGLSPELSAAMRPAFRIFLEHLTQLRMEMEAYIVDALEPNWKAPNWEAYMEVNRARVEQRAPVLSVDVLQVHYRAMLRALVLPHRRNVPEQATPIIAGASEVLPPDDTLLHSAIRRHSSAWQAPAASPPEEDSPAVPPPADAAPVAPAVMDAVDASVLEAPADAPAQDTGAPTPAATSNNEFDSLWTK